jgi:4a-hydroxytetrahydrobiopterin dehydratase
MNRMAQKLGEAELATALEATHGWELEDGRLSRTFSFDAYSSGAAFAVRVMMLAEKMDHHPDSLEVTWKKVAVRFVTHSAGGLTALDFEAAQKINAMSA